MTRVVFMGTPAFAVPSLQRLLATQTVVGVVTQPDRPAGRGRTLRPSPVKEAALAAHLPLYQPHSLRRPVAAAPIVEWAPDVIVVVAFGQILRSHLLELPQHGCLNVHASLLPRWRGAAPIQAAILAGDGETGVCLMQMERGLDTGPIIACAATPIAPRETATTLHDRLALLGAELLADRLDAFLAGAITPMVQPEDGVTYAAMMAKEDGRLDWRDSAAALDRRVRAMNPWPGAFTLWRGERLKILAAQPVAAVVGEPGSVTVVGETAVVATGDGALRLDEVQPAGKRAMDIGDFLRGNSDLADAPFELPPESAPTLEALT